MTNPHFKPLSFEGIAVTVPQQAHDAPFQVQLAAESTTSNGVEKRHFKFVSLDDVARDLAKRASEAGDSVDQWEWCHVPYKLYTSTPLSILHITEPLNWVLVGGGDWSAGLAAEDEIPGQAADQPDEDELGEISEMVAALQGPKPPAVPRSKATASAAKAKAAGSDWTGKLIRVLCEAR